MRNAARTEDGISGVQQFAAIANLKKDLALHHEEIFFLADVKMERWSALDEVSVLNDEKIAAGIAGRDFKEDRAVSARVCFSEAVLSGFNQMKRRCGSRRRSLAEREGR